MFTPLSTRYVTLTERPDGWEDISEEESYVKIGDPVEEIAETQEEKASEGNADVSN